MSGNRDQRLLETIKKDLLGLLQESLNLQQEMSKITGLLAEKQMDDNLFQQAQTRYEIFDGKASATLKKHQDTIATMPGVSQLLANNPKEKKLLDQLQLELPNRIAAVKTSHDIMIDRLQKMPVKSIKASSDMPEDSDLQKKSLFKAVAQTAVKGSSTALVNDHKKSPKK